MGEGKRGSCWMSLLTFLSMCRAVVSLVCPQHYAIEVGGDTFNSNTDCFFFKLISLHSFIFNQFTVQILSDTLELRVSEAKA